MKRICRRLGICGILLVLMLLTAGISIHATTVETKAATKNGWTTVNGSTYYYKSGKKVTGWLTLGTKKYYLNSQGVLQKGLWRLISNGKVTKHYSNKTTGEVYFGLKKVGSYYYYFHGPTGYIYTGFYKNAAGNYRYYYSNGRMATGWVKNSKGEYRYFNKKTGIMYKSTWYTTSSGDKRYFGKDGIMYTGLKKIGSCYYLFDSKNGLVYRKGFYKYSNGKYRYFSKTDYHMWTGWAKNSSGQKRYFDTKTGYMYTGLQKVGTSYYYFNTKNGIAQTGWIGSGSTQRYFDPTTLAMYASTTKTIDGVKYTFNSKGYVTASISAESITIAQSSSRTLKNYLAGALLPVGKALYVWGGGWNDSTRKGLSSTMTAFYNSQSSSYDYSNYKDLTTATRAKGFDCSGFVGWAAYQVMHTRSGVGYGYTVVSGEVGTYYKSLGWGSVGNQSWLSSKNYKIYPGDIGYDDGHVWIYLGQCADKSAVIVHSTPNAGVQISGTPTPSGNYDSEAVALAEKYMSKYSGYTKYKYNITTSNYLRRGNLFRWNSSTLRDPDGFKNKTAAQILAIMFGS